MNSIKFNMSVKNKNGIILRFPFSPKGNKNNNFKVKFSDFCYQKVKESHSLGYDSFIFELVEDDFKLIDFTNCSDTLSLKQYIITNNIRIALYIKSKKYLTSDFGEDVVTAIDELKKCIGFSICLTDSHCHSPVILHIGGAKGDRRGTMERFCKVLEENFNPNEIRRISVINDDKPSLFSVKDLLSGIFYRLRIPIVFRSTSYPTNQGNLTLNESLLLSASTWPRTSNPIFIYLPDESENIDIEGNNSPFGLDLDIIFDNKLPDPK